MAVLRKKRTFARVYFWNAQPPSDVTVLSYRWYGCIYAQGHTLILTDLMPQQIKQFLRFIQLQRTYAVVVSLKEEQTLLCLYWVIFSIS